jgi:REP element-mobilizing transposase RayT
MTERPETLRFYRKHLPHWEVERGRYFVTIRLKGAIPQVGMRQIESLHAEMEVAVKNGQDGLRESRAIFRKMEHWLHRAEAVTYLRNPQVAAIIEEAIRHRVNAGIWRMFSYVIMPNHLHLFFSLGDEETVADSSPDGTPVVAASPRLQVPGGTVNWYTCPRVHEMEVPPVACVHNKRALGEGAPTDGPVQRDARDEGLDMVLEKFKRWTATRAAKILPIKGRDFWQREWFDHWSRSTNEDDKIENYIRANPVKAGLAHNWQDWPWVK